MIKKLRIIVFFILVLFSIAGVWSAYSLIKYLPNPERITERDVVESTKIYDRTGKVLLYEIHGEEKRTVVSFGRIPDVVKKNTLAAEDINFYRHHGLDFKGVLRALIKNIVRGEFNQGGSTITQQLIKNSILTGEKTFSRKFKEVLLALIIEHKYSKDEILGLYLNQIPYGSNAYGIAAASETFFGKQVEELSLDEAATLAALPKAPSYYSPYGSHKEELIKRRNWILQRAADAGFFEKKYTKDAIALKPNFSLPRQLIRAPHFVEYVRGYLNDKYGEGFVEKNGLKVLTTLDWKLQEEAEKAIQEGAKRNEKLVEAYNASLVAIDPKSGEILSMVGSRDYFGNPAPKGCEPGKNCKFDPYVNIVTSKRQPGSAFKPFVYATAFKKGYTPKTVLFDVPTEFNPLCTPEGLPGPLIKDEKDCYHPKNYDDTFRGPVTLHQALAQSLNLPSVKLLYLAGIQDSIQTAKDFGITTLTNPENYGLSLVLGGAETTLLEMTSAFGALAQDGILHPKNSILRIENSKGVILEEKKEASLPVIGNDIARTLNSILSDNEARVPVFNPRSSLYFPDRTVAAKTGTTQDFRDAWVIGYTPSLVAGVWVGNNDNTPMNKSALSIMVAGPIWHNFMEFAMQNKPPEDFPQPALIETLKSILRGLYRSNEPVKIDKISQKLATIYTPSELIEEVNFGEIKSILTFIKKEDPLGNPPANPADDPQFENWQKGIDSWLKKNPLAGGEPPKDFDTIHSPDKKPAITLSSLPENNTLPKNTREIKVKIKTIFPLREASLFLNDELIDSKISPILGEEIIFKLTRELSQGKNILKVVVYDVVSNKETAEKEIFTP